MLNKFDDPEIQVIRAYFVDLQNRLCLALSEIDSQAFDIDDWKRPEGGGGRTRVISNGVVLEQAGVNFSHVMGQSLPSSAIAARPGLLGRRFQAMGISSVIHPRNPYAPTSHMNVRFFIAEKQGEPPVWWFGGGFDLTPYYGFIEDAKHWHRIAEEACQGFSENRYERYKTWCDEYFYLSHRKEQRGVGGLFFDDLNQPSFSESFSFTQSVGDHFLPAYLPILIKRKDISYGDRERNFQLYRRGRYVEFNLIYDRGTLFGLQSGGRTESILMSLPPKVRWEYDWQPGIGSAEAKLYSDYLIRRNWLA